MRVTRGTDPVILLCALALLVVGVVMVYSATFVSAELRFGSEFHFLKRHLVWAVLSLGALLVGRHLDYHLLTNNKTAYGLLALAAVLLALLFVPGMSVVVNGSRRWLKLFGFTIQPLEIAKVALLVFLAYSITVKRGRIRRLSNGLAPHLLIPGVLMLLVYKQPDFGGTVLLLALVLGMLFVGGARYAHLGALTVVGSLGAMAAIKAAPYRLARLTSFLDPWSDPQGTAYQLCNSLVAFGKGGWIGVGLGQGAQKGFFVPELHTDFILSNVAEEIGLLGVGALLAIYCVMVLRMIRVSLRAGDDYGRLLAFSVALLFALQVLMNAGVVMGMLPTKGLTLPLVSYGGSSLMCSMFLVGVVLNVASHHREYDELTPRPNAAVNWRAR
ncbi:MAG: putative lipid II flippase FtsW [Candidatus Alcyoniella australis]|nr:putative lipid II flippase FtsW [Candidatus Alcyoniella australis]